MAYSVNDGNGGVYEFSTDQHELADFTEEVDTTVIDTQFRTVSKWDLNDGEGVAFGIGNSRNPDKAEGYLWVDAKDDSTTPVDIKGRGRLVVLNSAGEKVPGGTIYKFRLNRVRNGDPDTDKRGQWGIPFPYQVLKGGSGEVLGGEGYQIGLQLQCTSSQSPIVYSQANSDALAEGYHGTKQN